MENNILHVLNRYTISNFNLSEYVDSNTQNRKCALVSFRNEETSLSSIASITIDTISFYSHVCQLRWNDKFVYRRAPRNDNTGESCCNFLLYALCRDIRGVVYNNEVR